jgi:hypothetical protein
MLSNRFQLLEEIDFVWEVHCADPEASPYQRQWDEMYQHLVEFKETQGHPNVPKTYQEWGLGRWVNKQRSEEKQGFLDPRRAEKLRAVSFTWEVDNQRTAQLEQAQLAYVFQGEALGNSLGPSGSGTARLAELMRTANHLQGPPIVSIGRLPPLPLLSAQHAGPATYQNSLSGVDNTSMIPFLLQTRQQMGAHGSTPLSFQNELLHNPTAPASTIEALLLQHQLRSMGVNPTAPASTIEALLLRHQLRSMGVGTQEYHW